MFMKYIGIVDIMKKVIFLVVLVGIGLYYLRQYMRGNMCHLRNRVDGKIVLITGANTGLGFETAVELVSRGATVHIACRDTEKCRLAKEKIHGRVGVSEEKVVVHSLDLASLRSIMSFSKRFKESVERLDILINNAGIMACPYQETEDGFEMQIGVNYIGHFLLTNELIDLVKKGVSPRIVIVSALAHEYGSINTSDINLRGDDYGPIAAYAQSKLANILHAKVLAKRLKSDGVAVVSLHPGVIPTELARHIPSVIKLIFSVTVPILYKTLNEGAQTQICCSLDPELLDHTGKYFSDCVPIESRNAEFYNESLADLLWDQTNQSIKSKLANIGL